MGGLLASVAGNGPIALLPVGDVPSDQLKTFASEMRRALGGRELLVSNDLRQTSGCVTQLLITHPPASPPAPSSINWARP